MAVGFSSYGIAQSGLMVSERGLGVTGHNLSNVDTVGYTRQQAMIESSQYITVYGKNGRMFQYGLGADIQETRQIRHTFLDNIYRRENTMLGYAETRSKTFRDVEAILNDPMEEGLQQVMNQFWDSWQELTKSPESLTTRALVRERGQALVYYYNHIGSQLEKLQNDLNSEIQVRVDEVNNITGQIAKLNFKIASEEINGDSANDYRDQRNLLLDRLSKLCDAEPLEMQDGQVDVTLGGYYLVQKGNSRNLYVEANAKNGNYFYPMLEGTETEVKIKSGILKGLMESRGEVPGIKGNYENGNPKEKVDIVFAIDATQGTDVAYLNNLKAQMATYINDLQKTGEDYTIRFVNMNGNSTVYNDTVYTPDTVPDPADPAFGAWVDNFFSPSADLDPSFDGFINTLEGIQAGDGFRPDATRVAYVFTNESIDGNDATAVVDGAAAAGYIQRLNAIGVKTSVITGEDYFIQGSGTTPGGDPEAGWGMITAGTGGALLKMGTDPATDPATFSNLVIDVNSEMRQAVNATMGNIPPSKNIVSDIKIKINAMVNALVKEINYLQKTGYTLDGKPGVDFFAPIDDRYPMQMGNLRLSDELLSDKGLNNITASASPAKGDNSIARKIANMRDTDIMRDVTGKVSVDEFYRALILNIGNGGSEADKIMENQTTLVQSVDGQRNAISGVSMDEEMANMMKFKFAYDASARVLNIIDSMIQTVVLSMGVVGR